MPGATTLDRIVIAAVGLLIAAFGLGTLGALVTPASADDSHSKSNTSAGNNGDTNNARTGTTRGTGPSNTNTRDTKTGTVTRNTRSVTG